MFIIQKWAMASIGWKSWGGEIPEMNMKIEIKRFSSRDLICVLICFGTFFEQLLLSSIKTAFLLFSYGVQGKTIGKPFCSSPAQGDKNPTMALLESTSQGCGIQASIFGAEMNNP